MKRPHNGVRRVGMAALFLLFSQLTLASCSERQMSDGALTQSCRPTTSSMGKEVRETHPTTPSKCKFGIALTCNACVYDTKGRLSHSVSELCGVCFGASF